jgi:hypothetical protein
MFRQSKTWGDDYRKFYLLVSQTKKHLLFFEVGKLVCGLVSLEGKHQRS